MKYLKILMWPLLGLPFFTACNDDDPVFDANADAFVMVRGSEDNGSPEFAPAYYVFANSGMKSVDVTIPGSPDPIELEAYSGLTSTFALEPEDADYQPMPPASGTYIFDIITNKNEEKQLTDNLESNFIMPTASLTATVEENKLTVDWEKVANAKAYIVRMFNDEDGKLMFGTNFLVDTTKMEVPVYSIGQQGGMTPQPGKTYRFELQAYLFEEGTTQNHGVNIQCVSTRQESIVWESEN